MHNIFRIGDVVTLKDNPNSEVGLVKGITDDICHVCWWDNKRGMYLRSKPVAKELLTLTTV